MPWEMKQAVTQAVIWILSVIRQSALWQDDPPARATFLRIDAQKTYINEVLVVCLLPVEKPRHSLMDALPSIFKFFPIGSYQPKGADRDW